MADAEIREILRETLELLRVQVVYTRNLHDAFSALHDTVMRIDPQAKQFDVEEMQKIRPNAEQQRSLNRIETCIRRLETLQ